MKKKIYLAVLAMCVALTASACGNSTTTENTKTETTAEQEEKKDTKEPEVNRDDTRIVSVDKLDKYVTLGEYKGIALDNNVLAVTDEDLEAQLDNELTASAEEVEDAAQNGDIVTINYVGTKDGVAFEGGTANNYDLTLGQGRMIPGFEDGIVGMKKGETKDVNLTFPEDYYAEDLAGADVVFKITCQTVRRKAELTDEWAAKNSDFATADEYREDLRKKMEEYAQAMAREQLKKAAWEKVVESSEVTEYPQEDMDAAAAEYRKMIENYAAQGGMEFDKFLESQEMTQEQFDEQAKLYAESKVKQILIIQAIMDAEKMTFNDEESLKIQDELIADSGLADLAALIDKYGQVAVDETIGLLRVENFIVDNAVITEKVTSGDTTAANADSTDAASEQTPDEENTVDEELEAELEDESADEDTVDVTEGEE